MTFMCVVSGVGIIRLCAAFVVSSDWSAGDGQKSCPPMTKPMSTTETTTLYKVCSGNKNLSK